MEHGLEQRVVDAQVAVEDMLTRAELVRTRIDVERTLRGTMRVLDVQIRALESVTHAPEGYLFAVQPNLATGQLTSGRYSAPNPNRTTETASLAGEHRMGGDLLLPGPQTSQYDESYRFIGELVTIAGGGQLMVVNTKTERPTACLVPELAEDHLELVSIEKI